MWQYALFTGKSPYFNYDEFIKELIEATESNDIPVSESIKWKSRKFNKIISSEIERRLQTLRGYWHVSILNAEQCIQIGKTLDRRLSHDLKRKSKSNLETSTKFEKIQQKRKEINSWSVGKYIIKNDSKFYLDLPQLGSVRITISKEDAHKIDYSLYVRNCCQDNEYMDDADNSQKNEMKDKITKLSDFHCQIKKNLESATYNTYKTNDKRHDYLKEFKMRISKSIDALACYIRNTIAESKNSNESIDTKYEYIPDYSWNNVSKVMGNFNELRQQISNDKHIHKDPYCEDDYWEDNKNTEVVAENIFSSYWRWWMIKGSNESEENTFKYKIKRRHETVLYFVRNMHFDLLSSSEYWKDLLSFLRKEIESEHKTKSGSFLVGWYNGSKVDQKLIKQFPFEILISINSTIARVQAISKWNEITCSTQLLCQTSFKYMFGFSVKDLKTFYGILKYVLLT